MQKLSMISVFSIALGSIIGWGAFMLPGQMFLAEAGIINTFIGLLLGAIAILVIENSFKFMVSQHHESGGGFTYVYKNLGEKHGFICGWFLSLAYLSIIPLNATAFPLVVDKALNGVLKFGEMYTINGSPVYFGEVLVSSLIILMFGYINIKGIKNAGKIQSYMTLFLVAIVLFVVMTMVYQKQETLTTVSYFANYHFNLSEVFAIFAITPWAFIGFDTISQLVNDFNFSKKNASKLSIIAILFGWFIYASLNFITGLVFNVDVLNELGWATGEAVLQTLGYIPFLLLCIALAFAVCSGINGFFVATTKLLSSIRDYNLLPVSNKSNSIIIFIMSISLLAPWFGREALISVVDMSSVGAAIVYGYVCYLAFVKSTRLKDKVIGGLGLLLSISFSLLLLIPVSPGALSQSSIVALMIWIILGGLFYVSVQLPNKTAPQLKTNKV